MMCVAVISLLVVDSSATLVVDSDCVVTLSFVLLCVVVISVFTVDSSTTLVGPEDARTLSCVVVS